MALIYVQCGQFDKAIDELEELVSQPTNYTVNDFKFNPELEPLKKMPRYQEMIRRYALPSGSM